MLTLQSSLDEISGIGEKRKSTFEKIGINSVKDLLEYFPISYTEIKNPITVDRARLSGKEYVQIKILGYSQFRKIVTAKATDGINNISVKWFNTPYIKTRLKVGSVFVGHGYIKKNANGYDFIQPSLYSVEDYEKMVGKIIPTYSLTKGITNNVISNLVKKVLNNIEFIPDLLSRELREEYKLCHFDYCIRQLHSPKNFEDLKIAKKRYVFEEFYIFMYKIRLLKENSDIIKNNFQIYEKLSVDKLENTVGYNLTNAQKKAIDEIINSLKLATPMSRLLQGDVGSGKTIVAIYTMINVALSGYQAAMMAPTEILAQQHASFFRNLVKKLKLGLTIEVLTSSTKAKEKREILRKLAEGEVDIIIGTHSIIWDTVEYKRLAYVVTDEQHRFGVNQRKALSEKGNNPHILVMSATPIPRTLAVMLYGDMDISIMDELPNNRIPIKNKVVYKDYEKATYNLIKKEVDKGRQAYVVCPLIEESEGFECTDVSTEYEKLRNFFDLNVKIGLLHGRMNAKEKSEIMQQFVNQEIDVLVSTVVIEVGVDVPNATVMVVVDPQRFGLAQLHQLRGRVGRGEHQSYCVFLILSGEDKISERLQILEKTNDGFLIANEDLKLRGPGEFFGLRQSGELEFKIADIYDDAEVIKLVSRAINKYGKAGLEISDAFEIDTI